MGETIAQNRRARHEYTIEDTFEAGHRAARHRDQERPGPQGEPRRRLRADRAGRGVDRRAPHRAVGVGRRPLQPRAEARPEAAAPPPRDRRAAGQDEGQGPDASCRSRSTSTTAARRRCSWGSRAASRRGTGGARSPTATPSATWTARWPTRAGARPARPNAEEGRCGSRGCSRRSTRTRRASPAGSSSAACSTSRARRCSTRCATSSDHGDGLRRLMLREPRGYPGRCAPTSILPPTHPEAQAGYVIMEHVEYPGMSGTNTICVVTALLETGHAADDRAGDRARAGGAGRPDPGPRGVRRRQGDGRDVPQRAGVRDPPRRARSRCRSWARSWSTSRTAACST